MLLLSLVSSSSSLSLLRKCHCAGSNFVGFILSGSTDPSIVAKFFRSWILKDFIQLRKRKRKSFICVDILHKREIRHFHVVRSRATTAKKCTKKSVMHVQSCCFANLILLLFCCSCCRRRHRCSNSLMMWNASRLFAPLPMGAWGLAARLGEGIGAKRSLTFQTMS